MAKFWKSVDLKELNKFLKKSQGIFWRPRRNNHIEF